MTYQINTTPFTQYCHYCGGKQPPGSTHECDGLFDEQRDRRNGKGAEAMTQDQLDALENAFMFGDVRELVALAREAIQLREALEFAVSGGITIYRGRGMEVCCTVYSEIDGSQAVYTGQTALEAIQKARGK